MLLIFLLLGVSCRQPTASGSSDGEAQREAGVLGGTLRYRTTSPVKTFNYLMATDEPSLIASFYLMGGRLVDYDHDKSAYVPALALSWEGDGQNFSLILRDDAKFSDGHPLTADDVAFTLRAIYDERTASPVFRDLMLVGGKPIEVKVKDARHLQLVFPQPVAVPESYFSNIAVLPHHVLEDALDKGTLREAESLSSDPNSIVCSGPFSPESIAPGVGVTLKRNSHYWKKDANGKSLPFLESVSIEAIADANNAITRLNQNTLDIIDRLRPTDFAALPHDSATNNQNAGPAAVRAYDLGPGLNTDHLWFNLNPAGRTKVDPVKLAWFQDARFRHAVARAIDRDSMVQTVMQGLATPLYNFVSPGNRVWAASDLPRDEYNLESARNLLREAGFTVGGTASEPVLFDRAGHAVEWTLIVPVENEPRKAMASIIQEDLAKLGIKIQIAPIEFSELSRRWSQTYEYDAVLLGTVVSEPDPGSYSGMLRSSGSNHFWFPKQEQSATDWERRTDELIDDVSHQKDAQVRQQSFREVQRILSEQMPMIPLIARHITTAATMRLGNYRPGTSAPYSLWNADELFLRQ